MRHTDQEISLTRLHSTEQAVRVTPAMEDAHDELVASIKAHGPVSYTHLTLPTILLV